MTAPATPGRHSGWRHAALAVRKDGRILGPENGKAYRARSTPIDGGRRLELRGHLGPFWRTQTWTRQE